MDASVNYLLRIVNAEIEHTRVVLSHLKEKERVLIKNDESLMRQIFTREHALFVKSRELGENRRSMISVLAKKWNLMPERLNLGVIVQRLEKSFSAQVAETRIVLKSLLEEVRHQNRKCEVLLKKSLQLVTFSIDLLRGKFQNRQKTIYGRDKRIEEGRFIPQAFMDRKG